MSLNLIVRSIFLSGKNYLPLLAVVSLVSSAFLTTFTVLNYGFVEAGLVAGAKSSGQPVGAAVLGLESDSFRVHFETKNSGWGAIYYGESPDELNSRAVSPNGQSNDHEALITGLRPETDYYFKICANLLCSSENENELYGLASPDEVWVESNIVPYGTAFKVTMGKATSD